MLLGPRGIFAVWLLAAATFCGCGGGSSSAGQAATPARGSTGVPTATSSSTPGDARGSATKPVAGELTDWPEFGLDAQRSNATSSPTGITPANVRRLRGRQVSLPGTVDSSPIYLHGVRAAGAARDVIVATTSYGRTVAIDANTGALLWTFTPPGYAGWAGGAQITNTSPIADPDRLFVYAASPNGLIHKLSLETGHEDGAGAWPVGVTRDATHEKLGAALNIAGAYVIAATSGYLGDAPTYQGHVVLIDRASGAVARVFNTLCAERRSIFAPKSCSQSDSAILSRGGAVVEPGGKRLLIDTGNGAWNGSTDFGDSVLELTLPSLALRQEFTPLDQQSLDSGDHDLGSSAPVLLGQQRLLVGGKDGIMRVLSLARLDGRAPGAKPALGGELQKLKTPGGAELFTAPAAWRHASATTVFVADSAGTAAYSVRGGFLTQLWSNSTPGTSPILAGGLLYVYEPSEGGIEVYAPGSPRPIAHLPGSSGHWNSPIVVDGHVVEPEGDANAHSSSGSLELFSLS